MLPSRQLSGIMKPVLERKVLMHDCRVKQEDAVFARQLARTRRAGLHQGAWICTKWKSWYSPENRTISWRDSVFKINSSAPRVLFVPWQICPPLLHPAPHAPSKLTLSINKDAIVSEQLNRLCSLSSCSFRASIQYIIRLKNCISLRQSKLFLQDHIQYNN